MKKIIAFLAVGCIGFAENIKLPKPEIKAGKSVMQSLQERKSTREFADKELTKQQLSNLLWSAWGINRKEDGKRTAPSAFNWQDISLYVALKSGTYVYNAKEHELEEVVKGDLKAATGGQAYVATASANLVYVSDYSKLVKTKTEQERVMYASLHTGLIAQNVNLFCASKGMGTVVRGWVDRNKLSELLKLGKDQKIVVAQSVGFPKK